MKKMYLTTQTEEWALGTYVNILVNGKSIGHLSPIDVAAAKGRDVSHVILVGGSTIYTLTKIKENTFWLYDRAGKTVLGIINL